MGPGVSGTKAPRDSASQGFWVSWTRTQGTWVSGSLGLHSGSLGLHGLLGVWVSGTQGLRDPWVSTYLFTYLEIRPLRDSSLHTSLKANKLTIFNFHCRALSDQ